MVNLTIDGFPVSVPEGTTVMKAAASIGIEIPHLCYLEGINEISACKVCVVELMGKTKMITACQFAQGPQRAAQQRPADSVAARLLLPHLRPQRQLQPAEAFQ